MADFIRQTFAGDLLRWAGFAASLQNEEESPEYISHLAIKHVTQTDLQSETSSQHSTSLPKAGTEKFTIPPQDVVYVVDWDGENDKANPRNWSSGKKFWVAFIVCVHTFVVYCASAIFIPSFGPIEAIFQVSPTVVSLNLAIYVFGYGLGPMIFSPLSEIAWIGRNLPYVVSFVGFIAFSIGVSFSQNFASLIILRFFQGFFGSPILASGGASLGDIYDWETLPFALTFWVGSMYAGPALGPLIAAYAVPHNWRWPLWEIAIMSAPVFILTVLTLPETLPQKILLRRAQRLRAVAKHPQYRASSELRNLNVGAYIGDAMNKPLEIMVKDPCIFFAALYGSFVYATYYSFFESFPLVYSGVYEMSGTSVAQVFICVIVGCAIGCTVYIAWVHFFFNPQNNGKERRFEARLAPALISVFVLPAGLFLFAWTSRKSIHWIVPTIGVTMYATSSFIVFQCLICYIPLSYPKYIASLLAGNDFTRSTLAAGFVMFSRAMYESVGIAHGVTILAGLSVFGILGMFYLYYYGAWLRSRSKFAES